jgi:Tol biopolymer transport system component
MRSNIWRLPIEVNKGEPTGPLERITEGDHFDTYPTVSEDGTKLVFTSDRSGNWDVWAKDLARGREIPLTFAPVDEDRAAISPDGSRVVFRRVEDGSQHLYLLRFTGGPEKLLCEDCPGLLNWTPDSRKVIYYWGEPARSATIDVDTGEKRDIVSYPGETASVATFSPDGRWLSFYVPSRGILISPVRGGIAAGSDEWFPLSDNIREYIRQSVSWWSPDGRLLYMLATRDGYSCIWKQRLDPATKRPRGNPEAVIHMHGWRTRLPPVAPGYGLAAGKLYTQVIELDGNIWLAEPRNGGS